MTIRNLVLVSESAKKSRVSWFLLAVSVLLLPLTAAAEEDSVVAPSRYLELSWLGRGSAADEDNTPKQHKPSKNIVWLYAPDNQASDLSEAPERSEGPVISEVVGRTGNLRIDFDRQKMKELWAFDTAASLSLFGFIEPRSGTRRKIEIPGYSSLLEGSTVVELDLGAASKVVGYLFQGAPQYQALYPIPRSRETSSDPGSFRPPLAQLRNLTRCCCEPGDLPAGVDESETSKTQACCEGNFTFECEEAPSAALAGKESTVQKPASSDPTTSGRWYCELVAPAAWIFTGCSYFTLPRMPTKMRRNWLVTGNMKKSQTVDVETSTLHPGGMYRGPRA